MRNSLRKYIQITLYMRTKSNFLRSVFSRPFFVLETFYWLLKIKMKKNVIIFKNNLLFSKII